MPRDHGSPTITRLEDQPGESVMFSVKNALVCAWYGRATEAGIARLERNMRKLMGAYPRGFSTFHVVTGGLLPAPSARAHLASLVDLYWSNVACSAVVLRGDGFWASAVKSFITGITMMQPRDSKNHVNTRIDAAAAWLAERNTARTGIALEAADLVRAAEQALALVAAAG